MRKIGMFRAVALCSGYRKMRSDKQEALRAERLRAMVLWAKRNSPYYAKQYQGLPDDFQLRDLPPVNKVELMAHFEDWTTDRAVTMAGVRAFMQDQDNIGRKFLGKYLVFTTSGSTGNPLVALCDGTTYNLMSTLSATRSIARKQDLCAFMLRGGRTMGVFATGGFYLGNSSVRAVQRIMPWKKRQMAVTSALLPIREIVEQLNRFKPAMLGGYPSNLELLIDEQVAGRLHIRPAFIMTGGEYLSDALRARLSKAFGCYVQTSYSCTEGGTIACECTERHFHVNDDWVIVEPVDKDMNPVPDGVQSDKILLTNLYNFTQPFIRYEVTDRVVMHHERCACGNPSPWLTIEGRTDDVLTFEEGARQIRVPPLTIYATLKEVHSLKRFQVVARDGNRIELRIEPAEGWTKEAAYKQAQSALANYLATHGVKQPVIALSTEEPQQLSGSGKFKHIINLRAR